jgi:hypothetical protein
MSHELYSLSCNALACSVVLPSVVLLAKRHKRRVATTSINGRRPTRLERHLARRRNRKLTQLHRLQKQQGRVELAASLEHQALQQMFDIEDLRSTQLRHWALLRSRAKGDYYTNQAKEDMLNRTHPNYLSTDTNTKKPWEE